jgi:hypothetical protein
MNLACECAEDIAKKSGLKLPDSRRSARGYPSTMRRTSQSSERQRLKREQAATCGRRPPRHSPNGEIHRERSGAGSGKTQA